MIKRITFRGMEHSPVLEEYCEKHLEKIIHLIENEPTPHSINLVLEAHHTHAYNIVELHVVTPHYNLMAKHEGPEMYQEVERVIDTMVQEIRKSKEKFKDHIKHRDSYKGA